MFWTLELFIQSLYSVIGLLSAPLLMQSKEITQLFPADRPNLSAERKYIIERVHAGAGYSHIAGPSPGYWIHFT